MSITIRPATLADLDAITEIYNEAIINTVATFDTVPKTAAQQDQWFAGHDAKHPILVALREGKVVGWASMSRYSDRAAYDGTAEISLYVAAASRGQGIGKRLMEAIVIAGQKAGLHCVLSRIAGGNEVSIHLHKQMGFETIGIMREVGHKFGKLLDVVIMQKLYHK